MEEKKKTAASHNRTLQFRLILSYCLLIAVILLLLNFYPPATSQRVIFQSKQSTLTNLASIFSSNLGGLTQLTESSAGQVVELLNHNNDTFAAVMDPSGRTIYFSPGLEQTFQTEVLAEQSPAAAAGKDIFLCQYDSAVFYSYAIQPILHGGTVVGVVCVCERDEEKGAQLAALIRNLHTISWVIVLAAAVGSILSSHVITKRVEQLLQAVQMMRQGQYSPRLPVTGNDELSTLTREFNELMIRLDDADQSQKRFVADASHELKTPLASIRLLADSLLQNEGMDRETHQEFLEDINTEVDRLSRITEELLILTRLEGNQEARADMLDAWDIVAEAFRALEPQAQKAGVRLERNQTEAVFIRSNPDDLFLIIKNLVENGIKYNIREGFVRVTLQNGPEYATLLVEDSGIGIPKELQARIFDRFYRVDKARSREGGGTGLGLSIVWNAVTKWNGTIRVGSRQEGGTWFRVEFPKALPEPAAVAERVPS